MASPSSSSPPVESNQSLHSTAPAPSHASSPPPNLSDPFYVHPNENPSLVLVTPILDGANYHCWAQAMTMALEMKNKFVFVDGTLPRPTTIDPSFANWKRCNMLALSWINRVVSSEISSSIIWITDTSVVWTELRNRFSQGDNTRIAQLHQEIFSLRQGESSVTSHFTKLRVLWDELCNFTPIPQCKSTSGDCCCHVAETVNGYRNRDIIMSFLQGLNDNFAVVRSQILLMEPLPLLSKVYSMVVQQERQIGNPVNFESSVANVQAVSSTSYGRGRGKMPANRFNCFCTYCNKANHTVETCFQKHGYPPGFSFKSNKKSVNNVTTEDTVSSASNASANASGSL